MSRQRTLQAETSLTGIGLHSGEACTVTFRPAPPGTGRVFVRIDLPGRPSIPSHPDRLCQRQRRTALAVGEGGAEVEVHTVEHCLSACVGVGLDNVVIEMTAVEMPGMDGSARDFAAAFLAVGLVEQDAPRRSFSVAEPISVSTGASSVVALPFANGLKITYTLDDHGGALGGAQMVELEVTGERFLQTIAPARTFCLAKEVDMLRAAGLGKGATHDNTCVYDGEKVIGTTLRFPDEAARHKVLDLIGDLAHAARSLNAHIIAVRSGHRENMLLVQELNRRIAESERPAVVFDIQKVLSILPHRYPMLLVDRIIDYRPSHSITGLKNVTVNEPWAVGHFNGMPVMPGVLLVEAMAQVGGVLLIHELGTGGTRVPLLMSLDKVKFRRPARPGDQLRITATMLRLRSTMSACQAVITIDGDRCAEAEIRCVMVDRAQ